MWKYDLCRAFVRIAFDLLTRVEVVGLENVPPSGPFILVMNHVHWLGPPLVLGRIPRYITALAASKWRRGPLGILFAAVGAVFVRRGEVDREALRKCLRVLEQGGALGLAPEGTRSHKPGMQRARLGVAYIADRAKVPILPIGVVGEVHVFTELKRLRRARVCVNIGPTFTLPPIDGSGPQRHAQLRGASDLIMHRIADLLPPEYWGVYRPTAYSEDATRPTSALNEE